MIIETKDKIIGILVILIILGTFGFIFGYKQYSKIKVERDFAKENVTILQKGVTISIAKNGDTVKTNGVIQQSMSELMKNDSIKSKEISNLKIKLKNITTITDGNVDGKWHEIIKFHNDTIHDIINGDRLVKVGILSDSCITGNFRIEKDSMTSDYHVHIPLFAIVHNEFVDKWKIKNIIFWRSKYPFISAYTTCKNMTVELHQTNIK